MNAVESAGKVEGVVPPRDGDGDSDGDGGPTRCLLGRPEDELYLSEMFTLVRAQLEAFVILSADEPDVVVRSDGTIDVGRVGFRCVHCAPPPRSDGTWNATAESRKGAVSYPTSTKKLLSCVRNWMRNHLMQCSGVPEEVKEAYTTMKSGRQRRSKRQSHQYWEESCEKMGMINEEGGIRLRNGHFFAVTTEGEGLVDTTTQSFNSLYAPLGKEGCYGSQVTKSQLTSMDQMEKNQTTELINTGRDFIGSGPGSSTVQHCGLNDHPLGLSEVLEKQDNMRIHDFAVDAPAVKSASGQETTKISDSPIELSQDPSWPARLENNPLLPGDAELTSAPERNVAPPVQNFGGLAKDELLARVKLAESIVESAGSIRPLPPSVSATNEERTDEHHQASSLIQIGAELYEIFSGTDPYEHDVDDDADNVELSQQQKRGRNAAKKGYTPLSQLGLPSALCSVVSSLLDSTVDSQHRVYSSAIEVAEDLRLMSTEPERFLLQAASGNLDFANLALYGREKEVSEMLEAFEVAKVAHKKENVLVLVSGYAGTGKSSLFHSVQNRFVRDGANVVMGKFDAMCQLQPFSAILSALDDYCCQLAQDDSRIKVTKEAVRFAVGSDGAVMASFIPSIGKILDVEDSPPVSFMCEAALPRLMFLFRLLLQATCSKEHPMVMFLDDLQWADAVSLQIMRCLVTDILIEGLLLIGCYRDNEVGAEHHLSVQLEAIRNSGNVNFVSIHMRNLDMKSANSLVSGALRLMPGTTRHLAEVVLQKTGGNPLFMAQFLMSLCDEGLLYFALTSRRWEWDISKVREKKISDNVVELMMAKLRGLAPDVQEALRVAAAFGAETQTKILEIIDSAPGRRVSTVSALDVAVSEGLMMKAGCAYRFSHDQIQCASCKLIPESDREAFHLGLGRLLFHASSPEEVETNIFTIIDKFDRGSRLITDRKEKTDLAILSLKAGQLASAMSAFPSASKYLKFGINLLTEEDWETNRGLCFDLYNLCAEMDYVLGDFKGVERHLQLVLQRARNYREKLRPYYTIVQAKWSGGNMLDAVITAVALLAELGEPFPSVVTGKICREAVEETRILLSARTEEELFNLERATDVDVQEAMKFLNILIQYTYKEKKEYFPLVACKMVRLSLLRGVCRESACGFAAYGLILCGPLHKKPTLGYKYGLLAIRLLQRFQVREFQAQIYVIVYGVMGSWIGQIQATLPLLKEAMDVGLKTGDIEYAANAARVYQGRALCCGQPLGPLLLEAEVHLHHVREYKQQAVNMQRATRQVILNLMGRSADPTQLSEDQMSSHAGKDDPDRKEFFRTNFYFWRLWLQYFFGEYQLAWETAMYIKAAVRKQQNLFPVDHAFYTCLAALALARQMGKEMYAVDIQENMALMKKWVNLTPWNCQHKLDLMTAEYAYLEGDITRAAEAYDNSINVARKHRFVHEEGLALERAGIFSRECGYHDAATDYFRRACDCYNQWGATSKVAQVQQNI